jgi:hypothetical protein
LWNEVISQQKELLKAKIEDKKQSVKNRIVSLSKPYVRSIPKWKKGKKIQFGAKAQIGMLWRKIAVAVWLTRENEHDSKFVKKWIEIVKSVRWKVPSEVWYDKWWRSQEIYWYLEDNGITNWIQWSEGYEKLEKSTKKRLYNRRAFNENIINDVLNHRHVNHNKYSRKNTEWSLLLGCIASNLIRVR